MYQIEAIKLMERFELMNKKDGIAVSEELHIDFKKIIIKISSNLRKETPIHSFCQLYSSNGSIEIETYEASQVATCDYIMVSTFEIHIWCCLSYSHIFIVSISFRENLKRLFSFYQAKYLVSS